MHELSKLTLVRTCSELSLQTCVVDLEQKKGVVGGEWCGCSSKNESLKLLR